MLTGTQITQIFTDTPRKVYVFRPNEEMTIEPEYFMHDKRQPSGTIVYDPLDSECPWIVFGSNGWRELPIRMLPLHCRAAALILPVPT